VRFHLKQLQLLLPVAVAAVAIAVTLTLRSANWIGDPLWGQEKVGIAQVLALPILAGGASVAGWRDCQGVLSLLTTRRQRVAHFAHAFAAWGSLVAVVYLVSAGVVNALSARSDPSLHNWSFWPVTTQGLAALLSVALGYLVGSVLNSWLGSVVAALLLAAVLILDRMGAIATGLSEYAASGTMLGAQPNPRYFLMRLAWMALLAAVVLTTLVVGPSVSARWTLLAFVILLGAGCVAFRTNDSYDVVQADSTSCSESTVRICAPTSFTRRAHQASSIAARTAEQVRQVGATPPTTLVMWQPGTEDENWVMLVNPGLMREPLRPDDVISGVVSPKGCRIWHNSSEPPSAAWFYADALVQSFVRSAITGTDSQLVDDLEKKHGANQVTTWVGAAARALQTCNPDAIPEALAIEASR
jgi:hypothetical protein